MQIGLKKAGETKIHLCHQSTWWCNYSEHYNRSQRQRSNRAGREVQVSCAQPWKVLIMMMMLRLPPKRDAGCWKLDIPLKCSIIDCSNGSRAWEFINLHVRPICVTQFECQKVKFQTKTQNTHSGLDDNVADRYFMFPRKHITIFIFIKVQKGRQTVPEVQCTCK